MSKALITIAAIVAAIPIAASAGPNPPGAENRPDFDRREKAACFGQYRAYYARAAQDAGRPIGEEISDRSGDNADINDDFMNDVCDFDPPHSGGDW